jgi:hypothetical protein
VAGINPTDGQIAFSDPFWNNAESGGAGRVLSGTLMLHSIPHAGTPNLHNDAGNVSHDVYTVTFNAISPGGLWEIEGYPYPTGDFDRQNCPKEFAPLQGDYAPGPPVLVEVEYALAMSPFHWKPGGEWVDTFWEGEWITEWWWYKDDGHSCLPDFWWGDGEAFYDGPAALANSLWWFDSKAETLLTGGWPEGPPAEIDHYDLITSYGDYDDHAITNTWNLIDDLAVYLNTTPNGTTRQDMASGIDAYLSDRGVAGDFYTETQ